MAESVRFESRNGIGILIFDTVDSRVNLVTPTTWREVDAILDREVTQGHRGLVLISGKESGFCAGADIQWLLGLPGDPTRRATLAFAHQVLHKLGGYPVPVVAALDGIALGGGLELALACHGRIATDREATSLGLPEITLGLIPGGGGTQLLPRVVGLPAALDLMLSGRTVGASEGLASGLVDRLTARDSLLDAAIQRIEELAPSVGGAPIETTLTDDTGALVDPLRHHPKTLSRAAAEGLVEAVEAGVKGGLEEGLRVEADVFERLNDSAEAASLLHLFVAEREVMRSARRSAGVGPSALRLFVIGGGMMGSAIAAQATDLGISARVRDIDERALINVHRYAERVIAKRSEGRTDAPYYRQDRVYRLSTSTDYSGIGRADVVIEAVFENADLKHQVISEIEPLLSAEAVLASNTSAIPIGHLASAAQRPERVIGTHFFSPVDRMPLLEIIPHAGTAPEVIGRAMSLGLALGKTPILVSDTPGFFTSRVYGRWLDEGTRLLLDGASIDQIDRVAWEIGFPVGPLVAQDEVSIRLVQRVATDPTTANITTHRVDLVPARRAIDTLVDAGYVGRSGGRGWYVYDDSGKRRGPDSSVYELLEIAANEVSDEEVADRILYSFVSEALHCLHEGVIRSTDDGDVASILGIGFPRRLGGPFHYMSSVGTAVVGDTAKRLDEQVGGFSVPDSL